MDIKGVKKVVEGAGYKMSRGGDLSLPLGDGIGGLYLNSGGVVIHSIGVCGFAHDAIPHRLAIYKALVAAGVNVTLRSSWDYLTLEAEDHPSLPEVAEDRRAIESYLREVLP